MPVHAPGPRLLRSVRLRALRRTSHKKELPTLMLTPMVDILALLVIYLLHDVSPMGEFV